MDWLRYACVHTTNQHSSNSAIDRTLYISPTLPLGLYLFKSVRYTSIIYSQKERTPTHLELVEPHILPRRDLALSGEVLRQLWQQAVTTLKSLQSPLGVTASGPEDQFHAIFGRDFLWTVLLALEAGRLLQTKSRGPD